MTDYRGSWPVMLTPFTDNGCVDFESLDRLVDWYEEGGSAGVRRLPVQRNVLSLP